MSKSNYRTQCILSLNTKSKFTKLGKASPTQIININTSKFKFDAGVNLCRDNINSNTQFTIC